LFCLQRILKRDFLCFEERFLCSIVVFLVVGVGLGSQAPINTQKIAIPTICAGCIIGKGGSVVRDLRMQSQTNISIAETDPAYPNERVVTLTGTPQGIQTAIYLIRQLVEQFQPPDRGGGNSHVAS